MNAPDCHDHCPDPAETEREIAALRERVAELEKDRPTWKDAPDAPGTWVIDYVLYHNRFIRLCKLRELGHPTLLEGRFMDSAVYRSDAEFPKGRWFGPIPSEDK